MSNNPLTVEALDEDHVGRIQWHCSEEGSGPDVGILLTLSLAPKLHLWAGEITKDRHEDAGEEAAELGDDFGTWLILYGEKDATVIGKCLPHHGKELLEQLAALIKLPLDEILLERAAAHAYGSGWDGPPEKQPGEKMKAVWIEQARKFVSGYLRARSLLPEDKTNG